MQYKKMHITEEPQGEVYRALLRHTLGPCDELLLIEPDAGLSEAGEALLARLAPHDSGRSRTWAWPGRRLTDRAATGRYFPWNEAVCEVILGAADGLYAWRGPGLPEGLFIQRKGTPWLVTHAHDGAAYVEGPEEEIAALQEALPGLKLAADGA